MSEKEPKFQTKKIEKNEFPELFNFDQQIEYYDKNPEKITPRFLNNFYLNIGDTWRRKMLIEKKYKRKKIGFTDERQKSITSDIKANQTYNQFFSELDSVLKDLRIEFEGIPEQDDPNLIPVYLELRRRGYSHYDLVQ